MSSSPAPYLLVVLRPGAPLADVEGVVDAALRMGCAATPLAGASVVVAPGARADVPRLRALPGVEEVIPLRRPYRLASREWREEDTVAVLGGRARIGGPEIAVAAVARPPRDAGAADELARRLRAAGASVLRIAGQTPPAAVLARLRAACAGAGLALAVEAADERGLCRAAPWADALVIGAGAMHNAQLLESAGRAGLPVVVTRGMAAGLDDLLIAAEAVLAAGNPRVMLCEGGVRGFDPERRAVLDLTAVPVLGALSHLPVLADVSAAGASMEALARAAVAAGADGVLLRVREDDVRGDAVPGPDAFARIVASLGALAGATGRSIASVDSLDAADPAHPFHAGDAGDAGRGGSTGADLSADDDADDALAGCGRGREDVA